MEAWLESIADANVQSQRQIQSLTSLTSALGVAQLSSEKVRPAFGSLPLSPLESHHLIRSISLAVCMAGLPRTFSMLVYMYRHLSHEPHVHAAVSGRVLAAGSRLMS